MVVVRYQTVVIDLSAVKLAGDSEVVQEALVVGFFTEEFTAVVTTIKNVVNATID